ncbi:hypothetical protein BU24DRAFT_89602 [Aaosphaeria arxii CBS 175.79]|uniref:Uncharacterized protein n=1 Tax=Aaosphaeria arxii CBS 175.79 TaxID=1450172 RepID=A0A6A5X7W1_9PLEO|nr:uncharacterized protein BU24DRAFT_89602 [Aaosphaeria arxii CBS 175.79]KAF2008996.1 hypothetical protein BU24DRAFT_89602 [Aaosphaeria arxii CBS 175.79]
MMGGVRRYAWIHAYSHTHSLSPFLIHGKKQKSGISVVCTSWLCVCVCVCLCSPLVLYVCCVCV